MNTIDILDRPIAFHRCFVEITKSVAGALLLSQAVYWQRRSDEWWWKTAEKWQEETGMRRYEFEQARKSCEPFLERKNEGLPCKTYYRVNLEKLEKALQTTLPTVCKPACPPSASRPADLLQSTTKETKEETKEETKALAVPSSQEPEELEPDELELEPPVGFKGNIEDLIYNAYPRKTAKPSARKAIGKAILRIRGEKNPGMWLLNRTMAFAEAANGKELKFIPFPATWFNQERYNDDLEAQFPKEQKKPEPAWARVKRLERELEAAKVAAFEHVANKDFIGCALNPTSEQKLDWKAKKDRVSALEKELEDAKNQRDSETTAP